MSTSWAERRRRLSVVLIIVFAVIASTLFNHFASLQQPESPPPPDGAVLAVEILGQLVIRERVSREGYSRNQFSSGWANVAGCDMRNRILQRDLQEVVLDDDNCTVLSGVLEEDPFTGKRIPFIRGRETSGAVHIEHLVAVSNAWQKGAQALNYDERRQFYNDPLNLVAVDGPANMEKGDKDASQWLPRVAYRCRYIARQIAVKLKYYLWVTPAEYNSMKRVLNTCPDQVLPVESNVPI